MHAGSMIDIGKMNTALAAMLHHLHAPVTKDSLQRGFQLFADKLMSLTQAIGDIQLSMEFQI